MQRRHFIILMLFSGLMLTMWFVTQIQRAGLERDHSNQYDAVTISGDEIVIDEEKLAKSTKEDPPTCKLPSDAYDKLEKEYMAQDALSRQISYLENMNGGITNSQHDSSSSSDSIK